MSTLANQVLRASAGIFGAAFLLEGPATRCACPIKCADGLSQGLFKKFVNRPIRMPILSEMRPAKSRFRSGGHFASKNLDPT